MKKFTLLVLFSTLVFANDGFFVGLGGGLTSATFKGQNYINRNDSSLISVTDTLNNGAFGLIAGYKSFFNDYLAYRAYASFDYHALGKIKAPENSTAQGIKASFTELGVNADLVVKPFEWLGVYGGVFVSYLSLSDIFHQNTNVVSMDTPSGANYGVNFGADFSFGNYKRHSIEFYGKINFAEISAQESGRLNRQAIPTIEMDFKRQTSFGLRYVYHFVSSDYENKINSKKQEKARKARAIADACPDFEREDLKKIKNGEKYYDSELEKGIVKVEGKTLYCTKIKVLSRDKETRKFAVNGSEKYDFNATITKESIKAQKIKNGKVIEDNVNLTHYTIEPVEVVSYEGLIYKKDAQYLKDMQTMLELKYLQDKLKAANSACMESGDKRYCDGDLVYVFGRVPIMVRVDDIGGGVAEYRLYYYSHGKPITEANYEFYSNFKMSRPEVYGNHNLDSIKKETLPDSFWLSIHEVATFSEW